ncbi:hypothetical protein AOLI_G00109480 [Acnodon oligacanthus]
MRYMGLYDEFIDKHMSDLHFSYVEDLQLLVEMSACRPHVFDAGVQFQMRYARSLLKHQLKAKSEDYPLWLHHMIVWGSQWFLRRVTT